MLTDAFERLRRILTDVGPEHLDLFKVLRHLSALFELFRENDFHSEAGTARFASLREEITLQIRNDPFSNSLLNALTFAHRCLAPFVRQRSSLNEVFNLDLHLI
jgi:hypothetical protein